MSDKQGFRGRLARFGHLIAGLVIVLKGVSKIEHHQNWTGAILILIGIVFGLFTIFHEKLSWIKRYEAVLLWVEALALAIVAYSYFYEGKTLLPVAYAFCVIAYAAVGFYRYRHPRTKHH